MQTSEDTGKGCEKQGDDLYDQRLFAVILKKAS